MHKVRIKSTGEEFFLPDGSYLTDAEELEVAGLTFGCRQGGCGICVIKIHTGSEHLTALSDEEGEFLTALGYSPGPVRLACQCRVKGGIEIDSVLFVD